MKRPILMDSPRFRPIFYILLLVAATVVLVPMAEAQVCPEWVPVKPDLSYIEPSTERLTAIEMNQTIPIRVVWTYAAPKQAWSLDPVQVKLTTEESRLHLDPEEVTRYVHPQPDQIGVYEAQVEIVTNITLIQAPSPAETFLVEFIAAAGDGTCVHSPTPIAEGLFFSYEPAEEPDPTDGPEESAEPEEPEEPYQIPAVAPMALMIALVLLIVMTRRKTS